MKEKPKVVPLVRGPDPDAVDPPDHMQRRDEAYQSGETSDRIGIENPEQFLAEEVMKEKRKKGKRKK